MSKVVDIDPWLRIEVDAELRYVRSEILRVDDALRDVPALVDAFDAAYDAALAGSGGPDPRSVEERTRPVELARAEVRSFPPMPDVRGRVPRWDLINAGLGPLAGTTVLQLTGTSDNECVTVRLDRASSRGRISSVDPGWLRQTSPGRLAAAIDEAFADAYQKEDLR